MIINKIIITNTIFKYNIKNYIFYIKLTEILSILYYKYNHYHVYSYNIMIYLYFIVVLFSDSPGTPIKNLLLCF